MLAQGGLGGGKQVVIFGVSPIFAPMQSWCEADSVRSVKFTFDI